MEISLEKLQALRQQSDSYADAAIAEIMEMKEIVHVNKIFSALTRNTQIPPHISPAVDKYFQHTAYLVDNLDEDKLRMGQEVFTKYGPTIFMVLFAKSLPECYSCANGAQVLFETGRMTESDPSFHTYSRRLMETAQFTLNVMLEGGLQQEGKGLITLRKIRLIHASIRYYLMKKGWDAEKYGLPINFEDELGTLMAFSVSILEGLEMLHLKLTEEQKDAYYYVWQQVGRFMDLPEAYIPASYAEGIKLRDAILAHQQEASEAGRVLTQSAIDFMNHLLPGSVFNHFPGHLMHFLVGDKTAETVDIGDHPDTLSKIALRVFQMVNQVQETMEEHSGMVRAVSRYFEKHLLNRILRYFNERKNIHFYIPPSLREDWGVEMNQEFETP